MIIDLGAVLDVERSRDCVGSCPCLWMINCKTYKDLRAWENASKLILSKLGVRQSSASRKSKREWSVQ